MNFKAARRGPGAARMPGRPRSRDGGAHTRRGETTPPGARAAGKKQKNQIKTILKGLFHSKFTFNSRLSPRNAPREDPHAASDRDVQTPGAPEPPIAV